MANRSPSYCPSKPFPRHIALEQPVISSVHGYLFNATLHGSKWLTGGTAGPEGNIFNMFLVAAGILLLSKRYPRVKYPLAVTDPWPLQN
jgi:hypothetical protein